MQIIKIISGGFTPTFFYLALNDEKLRRQLPAQRPPQKADGLIERERHHQ